MDKFTVNGINDELNKFENLLINHQLGDHFLIDTITYIFAKIPSL